MIEKEYKLSRTNEKAIEKIIFDENLHYLHMVFNKNEGLPEHFSNSNVYMTVIRGRLSIGLDDQEIHEYEAGNLLKGPAPAAKQPASPATGRSTICPWQAES